MQTCCSHPVFQSHCKDMCHLVVHSCLSSVYQGQVMAWKATFPCKYLHSQHSHPGSVWFLNLAVIFRVQIASLCRRLSDGVSPCCYASNRAQTTSDQGGLLCLQEPVTTAEPFIFLTSERWKRVCDIQGHAEPTHYVSLKTKTAYEHAHARAHTQTNTRKITVM